MTVFLTQIISGRRTGKTSALINRSMSSIQFNRDVLFIASSFHHLEFIASEISKDLKETGFKGIVNGNHVMVFDELNDCKLGRISFATVGNVRHVIGGMYVDDILMDDLSYLARDDKEIERTVVEVLGTICRDPKDYQVWTTHDAPLALSSELFI